MKSLIVKFPLFLASMFLSISFIQTGPPEKIHIKWKDIEACEGKLKLEFVRAWGGLEPEDESQLFHEPSDIEIGKDGLIYILDAGNSRIQVFDNSGTFIRTIGREGKGPAEFTYPVDMAIDYQNNLVISESMNRIQILDHEGIYKTGFKITETYPANMDITRENNILLYNGGRSKIDSLFLMYDYEGTNTRNVGKPEDGQSPRLRDLINLNNFCLDNADNLCVAYILRPLLEKYSKAGERIWQASYELPFKTPDPKIKSTARGTSSDAVTVSAGLATDYQGRIYMAALTREKLEEEKKVGVRMTVLSVEGNLSRRTLPHDVDSSSTDLYQLLVFDSSGRIIASNKLDVFCDKIKVHGDRLFVIDSYVAAKIYEYKISFE